jgi:hypothetical protein
VNNTFSRNNEKSNQWFGRHVLVYAGPANNSIIGFTFFKNNLIDNNNFNGITKWSSSNPTQCNSQVILQYSCQDGNSFHPNRSHNFYVDSTAFLDRNDPIGKDKIWFTEDDGLNLIHCGYINKGLDSIGSPADITDSARIQLIRIDPGAYEFRGLRIKLSAKDSLICPGDTSVLTAGINIKNNYTIQWYVNGSLVSGQSNLIYKHLLNIGDSVQVKITSIDTCYGATVACSNVLKIKQYLASSFQIQVSASSSNICSGTTVNFSVALTPPTLGNFQWYRNGLPVGANQDQYSTPSLSNKDSVWVQFTPSIACLSSGILSNKSIVTVLPTIAPSASVTLVSNKICSNGLSQFKVNSLNTGSTPSYAWLRNGLVVPNQTDSILNISNLNIGDRIASFVTSSYACPSTAVTTSFEIVMVKQTNRDTIHLSGCKRIVHRSKTYEQSGTYFDTLFGICDTVRVINVQINRPTKAITLNSCKTIAYNSKLYSSTGIFYDTIYGVCDTVVILDLTIGIQSKNLTYNTCTSVSYKNKSFSTSGTYYDTLRGVCDTFVKITVNKTTVNKTHTIRACDSAVINGLTYKTSTSFVINKTGICDSILTYNLTISKTKRDTLRIQSCKFYIFGNQIYFNSGFYTLSYKTITNCDSMINLDLEILNIGAGIQASNGALSVPFKANTTYQWYSCNPMTAIAGATSNQYTPASPGSYRVVSSNASCTDTSKCINSVSSGLADIISGIMVYPNPFESKFKISTSTPLTKVQIQIYDLQGKMVHSLSLERLTETTIILEYLASGSYQMTIDCAESKHKGIYRIEKR